MGVIDKLKAKAGAVVDEIKAKVTKSTQDASEVATGNAGELGKAKSALKSRKQRLDEAEAEAVGTTAASRKAADDEFKKAWEEK
jgi:hypothetical protein